MSTIILGRKAKNKRGAADVVEIVATLSERIAVLEHRVGTLENPVANTGKTSDAPNQETQKRTRKPTPKKK